MQDRSDAQTYIDRIDAPQPSSPIAFGIGVAAAIGLLAAGYAVIGTVISETTYIWFVMGIVVCCVLVWLMFFTRRVAAGTSLFMDQKGLRGTGDACIDLAWRDIRFLGIKTVVVPDGEGGQSYRSVVEIEYADAGMIRRTTLQEDFGMPADDLLRRIQAARKMVEGTAQTGQAEAHAHTRAFGKKPGP